LDSVEVQGQRVPSRLQWFYQRRAEGPGEFFTREEIERLNPVVPTDILQPVRGISVVRAGPGVRLASRQDPAACGRTDRPAGPVVFLDGLLLGRGMALNLDGLLTANAIEAVEVYAGSGDVPPEFDRPGAECGAVSLWTRAVVPAPAPTPVFEAGGQFGTWISSGGLAEGRLGVRFVIGFTSWVEVNAAVNQIIEGLETGSAGLGRTGSQVIVAARGRPLGRESPFYLGVGATFLALRVSSSNVNDEDHAVVLAGAAARVGRVRPFVELQAVAPWGDAQLHAYTGVTVRLY
jgi:hypothetical protein